MKNFNPNGAAEVYDFAKANRFRGLHNRKTDVKRSVYAQDADGICYHFKTVTEAAKAVMQNGYCLAEDTLTRAEGNIYKAATGARYPNCKELSHRMYGFEWRFTSEL